MNIAIKVFYQAQFLNYIQRINIHGMKTMIFFMLIAGIGLSACSTTEQSQTPRDSSSIDTTGKPPGIDSLRTDSLKKDTMPIKKDSV